MQLAIPPAGPLKMLSELGSQFRRPETLPGRA
jgi:hypothetical protein